MRPIKLTISAFGPYKNKEVIDFCELNGENIFVISGKTGCGKTTIFDAISFSLFGEASGESRETKNFRSHFSDDEVETFVEFEFEIKGEKYKVFRNPSYLKKKKDKDEFTEKKSNAELILPNGEMISKVGKVNEKIIEILGINKQQFKQIAMLAQGEFKKLLLAESVEREFIFRKIFDTYKFEKIQENLKEKEKKLSKQKRLNDEVLKSKIISLDFGNLGEELNEKTDTKILISNLEKLVVDLEKDYKELVSKKEKLKTTYEESLNQKAKIENNNNLIKEKEKLANEYNLQKEKFDEFEAKKVLIENIKNAKEILSYEKISKEKFDKKLNYEKLIDDTKINIKELEKQFIISKESLENEEKNNSYRENLIIEIEKLKLLQEKLNDLESIKEVLTLDENVYNKLMCEIEKIKAFIKTLEDEEVKVNENIKNISELKLKKEKINTITKEKEALIEKLRDLLKEVNLYEKNLLAHKNLNEEYINFEKTYKNLKEIYENMEEAYKKDKAGILANSLKENCPCPVCGSTNHPNKASLSLEIDFDENDLKNKKNEVLEFEKKNNVYLEKLTTINAQIKNNLSNINNSIENQIAKILGVKFYDENLKQIIKKVGTDLKQEIDKSKEDLTVLENEIKKEQSLNEKLIEVKNNLSNSKINLQNKENEILEIKTKITESKVKIENFKKEFPDEVCDLKTLNEKIISSKEALQKSKEDLQMKKQSFDKVNEVLNKEKTSLIEKQKVYEEVSFEFEKAKKDFDEILGVKFCDKNVYEASKEKINVLESLENEVSNYYSNFKILEAKNIDLNEKTVGLEFIDISAVLENINEINEKILEIEKNEKNVYSRLENNQKIIKDIKTLDCQNEKIEKDYKIIGELSKISNGENSLKLSFERYILASYFDDIIEASNIRLKNITNSRFKLIRKDYITKKNKKSGLDLLVYDEYTGKEREVSSLSGGESFKASLCLALGLSDVIQESSGGICIETIFVDEGFGTLDSESLNCAIDCLLDLQEGGRLVGIISHVDELKQRINKKLEIISSPNGSVIKSFN